MDDVRSPIRVVESHDPGGAIAGPLTIDEVRVAVAGLTAPWTLAQLSRALGRPQSEVATRIVRLLDGGTIEDVGPDPRHTGAGPASRLYSPVVL